MIKDITAFDRTRLKALREFKKLSHDSFGKKIGKSKITIIKWEKGTTMPGIDDIQTISRVFEVDPLAFWVRQSEQVISS